MTSMKKPVVAFIVNESISVCMLVASVVSLVILKQRINKWGWVTYLVIYCILQDLG
jgi:hypothetical protein